MQLDSYMYLKFSTILIATAQHKVIIFLTNLVVQLNFNEQ